MSTIALFVGVAVIFLIAIIYITRSRRSRPLALREMHHRLRGSKKLDYGQYYDLAVALFDGPRTVEEIKGYYSSYLRLLSFFTSFHPFNFDDDEWSKEIESALEALIERDWAVREEERYTLTPLGKEEASKPLKDIRQTRNLIGMVIKPENVSKASTVAHFLLAALKLPAALLSGSVGLLNDSIDTLLDGFSSILVYLGFRFDRERLVNMVLTLLMLCTAGLTLHEAVTRFFIPFQPDVDWFTFTATILSALICGGLYFYQRFIGLRSGRISLITQSVDSRNHIIIAASVTAGLIASLMNFGLLDTLVGLGVALIILKSAVELLVELIRSMGEEKADLSRYGVPFADRYEDFRKSQLRDWMLYIVDDGRAKTMEDLKKEAQSAYDFSNSPMLRELGLGRVPLSEEKVQATIQELFDKGWLTGVEKLRISDMGKKKLHKRLKKDKHILHY
jgi:hypothetical protein